MKLKSLINKKVLLENDGPHKFGCVMLYFDFPEMFKLQDIINPQHLYEEIDDPSYGLENEPHLTLLYGNHSTVSVDDVKAALKSIIFDKCRVQDASIFKNDKYDVLKFDVNYATRGGAFLLKANDALKQFPYTSDYPDYHPHMTIGYIKPGFGQKYADMISRANTSGYTLVPKYAVYSQTDGTKTKIKINIR